MGVAAYHRGSRAITAQICAEYRCPGCSACRAHVPTPRPPGWGAKAAERALDHAMRVLAGADKAGLPRPTAEMLTDIVQQRARVGQTTAAVSVETALTTTPSPTRPTAMPTAPVTATIITKPVLGDVKALDVHVLYSDGREPREGIAHLRDAAGSPDPTGWTTCTLSGAEPDVLRAILQGIDEVEL